MNWVSEWAKDRREIRERSQAAIQKQAEEEREAWALYFEYLETVDPYDKSQPKKKREEYLEAVNPYGRK